MLVDENKLQRVYKRETRRRLAGRLTVYFGGTRVFRLLIEVTGQNLLVGGGGTVISPGTVRTPSEVENKKIKERNRTRTDGWTISGKNVAFGTVR